MLLRFTVENMFNSKITFLSTTKSLYLSHYFLQFYNFSTRLIIECPHFLPTLPIYTATLFLLFKILQLHNLTRLIIESPPFSPNSPDLHGKINMVSTMTQRLDLKNYKNRHSLKSKIARALRNITWQVVFRLTPRGNFFRD